jgi:hypothetical protein
LPIRIHELLLSLAGRLDDDALADARQMLASAELDRSLEFVAGCLVAGRVTLAKAHKRELESLFADTYLDSSVIDRIQVRDPAPVARHRFAVGAVEGREPDRGVADAIRPVLDVLPDVRSVWCVWRLTPAGPVSGPVPHRIVLVGVGPGGFAPATAYRVEYALRRAGIRASVEVLVDGNQPGDYHQEAMRCARQVPFAEPDSANRPRMSPVEPVRTPAFGTEPRHDQPVPVAAPAEQRPLPPPIELPRTEERTLPPPIELPQAAEPRRMEEPPNELPPPIELHRGNPDGAVPTPPRGSLPPPIELRRGERSLPPPVELRPAEPTSVEAHRPDAEPLPPVMPPAEAKPVPRPNAAEETAVFEPVAGEPEPRDDERPPPALSVATPSISRPSPRRRPKAKDATRPRLVPASKDNHSATFGDDILNTQERNLLRELQDELARREEQEHGSTSSSAWSGRHGKQGFDAQRTNGGPMTINGTPPNPDGYPPAT